MLFLELSPRFILFRGQKKIVSLHFKREVKRSSIGAPKSRGFFILPENYKENPLFGFN